jgi:hypothetical protein
MKTEYKTIKTRSSADFDKLLTSAMSRDGAELVYIGTEIAQGHEPGYAEVYQVAVVSFPTY